MSEEIKQSDRILKGILDTNSFNQFIVKGKGMKEHAVIGNPGRITNRQRYKFDKVRFTYDGHFAWII
jgi:hypothetical protein